MICTASNISIRPAVASDVPQIAEMMRSVSEREHSVEAVRMMTGDFLSGDFYAWLAFAGDEPIGVTMLEPCVLEHNGIWTKAGYWRYLWVRPDQRRTALYPRLVFTMLSEAAKLDMQVIYGAIRRPEVAAGHIALGMQKVGEIPVLVKPLRPGRLFSKYHGLGNVLTGLSAVPDFAYQQYLSAKRWATRSSYSATDFATTEIEPETVASVLRSLYPSKLQRPLNRDYFRKRYGLNSDGAEYRVLTVNRSGALQAAVVYRPAVRGNNIHALVLMELGFRGSDPGALRFGLLELEKKAIHLGCEVMLALTSPSEMQQFLKTLGYFRSNEMYILIKKATPLGRDAAISNDMNDWYFTFSDHDAF